MASIFDDLWQSVAFPALADRLGKTVVYTPYTNSVPGDPVTFCAPFAEVEGALYERAGFRDKAGRRGVLEAPASIDGEPQTYVLDSTFLIDGVLWGIDRFGPRDCAQITIHLKTAGDQKLDRVGK